MDKGLEKMNKEIRKHYGNAFAEMNSLLDIFCDWEAGRCYQTSDDDTPVDADLMECIGVSLREIDKQAREIDFILEDGGFDKYANPYRFIEKVCERCHAIATVIAKLADFKWDNLPREMCSSLIEMRLSWYRILNALMIS